MVERNSYLVPEGPLTALKLLSLRHIPFVIVGGAAIALHGIPRSTLDVDIIIPADSDIVLKLFSTVEQAGLFSQHRKILHMVKRPNLLIGQWIAFEDSEGNALLDVFFEESKTFDRLMMRTVRRKGKHFAFCIACLDDLEAMKKASGRPIDIADIALIQEKRNFTKQKMKREKKS